MFCRNKALFVAAICLGALPVVSVAGGDVSSGGGAMVCRDSSGAVTKAYLLDLWEIQFRKDNAVQLSSDADVEIQLKQAVERVKNGYGKKIADELADKVSYVRSRVKNVDATQVVIPAPKDILNDFQMRNCPLEGAALFKDDEDVLYINPEVVNAMPKMHQAALWIHEAVYWARRHGESRDQNSIVSRKFVGQLFSTAAAQTPVVPGGSYILCQNGPDPVDEYFAENFRYSLFVVHQKLESLAPIEILATPAEEIHILRLVEKPLNEDPYEWGNVMNEFTYACPANKGIYQCDLAAKHSPGYVGEIGFTSGPYVYDQGGKTPRFSIGIQGGTSATGAIMTYAGVQKLYAPIRAKQKNDEKTVYFYSRNLFSGQPTGFERNYYHDWNGAHKVEPLCRRYSSDSVPLPW
jgi:hypothetical protein